MAKFGFWNEILKSKTNEKIDDHIFSKYNNLMDKPPVILVQEGDYIIAHIKKG